VDVSESASSAYQVRMPLIASRPGGSSRNSRPRSKFCGPGWRGGASGAGRAGGGRRGRRAVVARGWEPGRPARRRVDRGEVTGAWARGRVRRAGQAFEHDAGFAVDPVRPVTLVDGAQQGGLFDAGTLYFDPHREKWRYGWDTAVMSRKRRAGSRKARR
jgi:hypothetical protein